MTGPCKDVFEGQTCARLIWYRGASACVPAKFHLKEFPLDLVPIRRALVSVSDKSGLKEFAANLKALNVEIYSTGGTLKFLISRASFQSPLKTILVSLK